MRLLRAFALLAAGCAGSVAHVHVAVELTGAGAGPAALERCVTAVRAAGGVVDAQSGLHALVTVEPNGNRVQLLSDRRGLVHDRVEPQAPVEQLCRDALAAATTATRREPLPSTGVDDRARSLDERALTTPTASGPATQGPISDQ
jgi:hypothetical protein